MSNTVNLLGFEVTQTNVDLIVSEALCSTTTTIVNTINPHSYIEQKKDKRFNTALRKSHTLIPDGSGMVLAAKVIYGKKINKIAGFDLFAETMKQLNEKAGSVFFLGASPETLKILELRALKEFPRIVIKSLSPPFKSSFEQEDIMHFASIINSAKPDVLFVGLTAPKQEKLIQDMYKLMNVKMISGIGAVFDFYAGTIKRPHQFWLYLHLEWLVRLIGEPKRLWKRNFISTPLFIIDLIKCKLGFFKIK